MLERRRFEVKVEIRTDNWLIVSFSAPCILPPAMPSPIDMLSLVDACCKAGKCCFESVQSVLLLN